MHLTCCARYLLRLSLTLCILSFHAGCKVINHFTIITSSLLSDYHNMATSSGSSPLIQGPPGTSILTTSQSLPADTKPADVARLLTQGIDNDVKLINGNYRFPILRNKSPEKKLFKREHLYGTRDEVNAISAVNFVEGYKDPKREKARIALWARTMLEVSENSVVGQMELCKAYERLFGGEQEVPVPPQRYSPILIGILEAMPNTFMAEDHDLDRGILNLRWKSGCARMPFMQPSEHEGQMVSSLQRISSAAKRAGRKLWHFKEDIRTSLWLYTFFEYIPGAVMEKHGLWYAYASAFRPFLKNRPHLNPVELEECLRAITGVQVIPVDEHCTLIKGLQLRPFQKSPHLAARLEFEQLLKLGGIAEVTRMVGKGIIKHPSKDTNVFQQRLRKTPLLMLPPNVESEWMKRLKSRANGAPLGGVEPGFEHINLTQAYREALHGEMKRMKAAQDVPLPAVSQAETDLLSMTVMVEKVKQEMSVDEREAEVTKLENFKATKERYHQLIAEKKAKEVQAGKLKEAQALKQAQAVMAREVQA